MPTQLDKIIFSRRSVRKYTNKLPTDDQIKQLIKAANAAPSSCNMQLWEFIYVSDKKILKKLAKVATHKVNWAPGLLVCLMDTRITKSRSANMVSFGAAMQNISLKAVDLGLATCSMAGFVGDKKIKQLLEIPDEYEVVLLIGVGYADETPPQTYRSKPTDILHYNGFSKKRPQLKTSIYLKDWAVEQVFEYRHRIMSTYLWRFKIRFFDEENSQRIFKTIEPLLPKSKSLSYIYPWNDQFIPWFKKITKKITLWDENQEVVTHFGSHFKLESNQLQNLDQAKKVDSAVLINSLEFDPEPEKLFQSIQNHLKADGQLIFTIFNKQSIYIRLMQFAIYLKYFPDVYHKSPFYKYGPVRFYSFFEIEELLTKTGFTLDQKIPVELNLTDIVFNIYEHNIIIRTCLRLIEKVVSRAELYVITAKK